MVIKLWISQQCWQFEKSDSNDFMDASDAVTWQHNVNGEKVWEMHQKEISTWPEAQHQGAVIYAAFGENTRNCLKNSEPFSKEFWYYV